MDNVHNYADSSLRCATVHSLLEVDSTDSKSHIHHINWVIRYGLSGFIASWPGHPARPDLLGPRTEHACAGFSTSTNHPQQVHFPLIMFSCDDLYSFDYFLFDSLSFIFLFLFDTFYVIYGQPPTTVQAYIVAGGHRGDGVGLFTTEILLPGKQLQ